MPFLIVSVLKLYQQYNKVKFLYQDIISFSLLTITTGYTLVSLWQGGIAMFGELLRELRKDHGMTQVDLAKELSLSPLTISAYERSRCVPDDSTKVKIAKLFNISLDYLLGLIREPLPYERSDHAVQCPQDFTAEDIQKVREYIKFLEFQKKAKQ